MEYHHHHQGRYDDDEAERRRYQPPPPQPGYQPYVTPSTYPPPPYAEPQPAGFYGGGSNPVGYPPHSNYPGSNAQHMSHERGYEPSNFGGSNVQHVAHERGYEPSNFGGSNVQHVSHERGYEPEYGHHGHGHHHGGGGSSAYVPPPPSVPQTQHNNIGNKSWEELMKKPTVRIYLKAGENYSLSIRDGKVILARADERDPYQHWIKDMRHSTRIKDEEGYPAFALVNKATGEAIKHSFGAKQQVRLIKYNPDYLDESVLWTESRDVGHGFRCIRMVNNIYLNFDAFHGDKEHGGVRDGTIIQTWEWLTGDNQKWKIVPY